MASRSEFSAQTLSVLASLCQEPSQWQHGYALAKQTGLKSGTLYPILIRLAGKPEGDLPQRYERCAFSLSLDTTHIEKYCDPPP